MSDFVWDYDQDVGLDDFVMHMKTGNFAAGIPYFTAVVLIALVLFVVLCIAPVCIYFVCIACKKTCRCLLFCCCFKEKPHQE